MGSQGRKQQEQAIKKQNGKEAWGAYDEQS